MKCTKQGKMTINNQIQRVFSALVMLLLLSTTSFAQHPNLIINGGFEPNGGGAIYSTDYERTYGGVVEAGHYAVDNTTANYGGGGGWPEPTGSTGRFMMVNGFGGGSNPSKVVWSNYHHDHPYIAVVPNTQYTFSCRVVNLNVVIQGQINPAKLQLKINGDPVGSVNQLPSDNNWHNWTIQWNSGDAEQAVIQIVDMYTSSSGLGDDYALDDMSFRLDAMYSLTANSFTVQFCGDVTPIDLSDHYTMTNPSGGNSAPPMQVKIRKAEYYTWATSITTNHGTAYVGNDNKIYYTPNEGYYGSDSFQYQISRFGLESYNTITLNIGNVPTNCTPQGLPTDNLLCISNISSFSPSASWSSNGSDFTSPPGWQYKKIGVTDWQDSYTFQNYVQQWGLVGEYSIRFFAENSCGTQYSEPYNFNICDIPQWVTQPTVSTICTGSSEPSVGINWNFNTGVQTWQYKRGNGNWTDFVWGDFDLQPGDQIRYRVTYDACGGNPLISQTINVVSGPQFNSSIPVSFEEGYCPGSTVTLPQIQTSWYNAYGMTVTSGWYYVNYNPSGSPSYVPISGNSITLNNGSVTVTPCLQNTECGFTPYFPAFDLVVWEAPAIQGLEELPDSLGPVCSGTALSSILPTLSPDGHYTNYGWEISAGQSQSGYQSNLPQTLSVSDNGRWLRYRVEGCSQYNDVTSSPIRIWVGDAPTLNTNQISSLGTVCAGTMIASLVDVHVTNWNLFDDPEESFGRWEVNLNGTWTEFTQFELSYNGCQVRYLAHNECGDVIVSAGTITVTEGPSFNNPGAPLDFADSHCDGEYLELPTHPSFNSHGINVNDEYWAYFDGTEYHRITSPPQVDETWNGYQITYVLESDCGGEIYYPTPHTLVVMGNPVVNEISLNGSNTFCVDASISLDVDIDWHLCTQNTQESSWRYAPVNQPNNYSNFNPNIGIPEAGTYLINYHAVANECGFDAYGTPLTVTIEAAPEFANAVPFELGRFCEDDLLQLPSNPVVTGHVDESGWQISVGNDPEGEYTEINSGHVLTLSDNGRWLKYYALGCNVPIQHIEEIHVDGKPLMQYGIADRICKGQPLSYQPTYTNGYPVTEWDWRIGSISGDSFNPDVYTFDIEGDYLIYYRVGNDCGWSEYEGPLHLSVTAGPEFVDMSYGMQYVCEGTTVGELLQQSGITEPSLVDPSVPHTPLGWFINDQAVELNSVIHEGHHDAELRYGVSGDCSDVPVYSRGVALYVYGRPEVTQMPSIDWEFCDGDAVLLPNPDINFHNGEGHVTGQWQMQSDDDTWGNLPTIWSAEHNGLQVRYHLEQEICSGFGYDSWEIPITIYTAPTINDDDLPSNTLITLCYGGALGIDEPEVLPETNVKGWQVSANGTDWSTELDGHIFNPNHVNDFFDGKYLRYHAESTQCPNLEDNSEVYTIQLMNSPSINDADWPSQVPYCSGGSLGIDIPGGLSGEWQVSSDEGANWSTELEGYVFDPDHIDDIFDGMRLRYYVHTSCGDAVSKELTLRLMAAINMPIIGETQVAMMNSFWTGIYDYHIDSADLVQPVQWSLEGADWPLQPLGMARCLVFVNSIGAAVLHARITNELCSNEVDVLLPINATHFGVEDNNAMEVTIYPNPTRNTVTIEAEGIERIRLTNMMGQVLEMREYGRQDSAVLNLDGYTPSVYLLEVKTINGVAKKRLILYR
jgi:hypothetical protein